MTPIIYLVSDDLKICTCAEYQNESKNTGNQVKIGRHLVWKIILNLLYHDVNFVILNFNILIDF
jgi:hypothetical protein